MLTITWTIFYFSPIYIIKSNEVKIIKCKKNVWTRLRLIYFYNAYDYKKVSTTFYLVQRNTANFYSHLHCNDTLALSSIEMRVIWMEVTLRGLKDWNALMLETYGGTAKLQPPAASAVEATGNTETFGCGGKVPPPTHTH